MTARLVLAAVVCLLLAGCAGEDAASETTTDTIPQIFSPTNDVRVYFLREGKVWPALREVPAHAAQANAALAELIRGPTEQEAGELGWTTALTGDTGSYALIGPGDQRGAVSLEVESRVSREARAQIVYTLTQFPLIEAVILNDKTYRRADFEDLTPPVLVESPLAFDDVASPLHVFGTANTFEATFSYEVTDTDGRIVDEDFVTATSGTGTRGTYEFTTDEFDVPFDGVGSLIVFELSAKDGSRIDIVEIPLQMAK